MECFTVYADEIDGRIDPHFYRPVFKNLYSKFNKIKLVSFGQIIKSLINGFDYRKFSEDGLTYLRVSNIKPFEFYLDNVKKINPDFEINKRIKLKRGNLLLTRKGTFGVVLSLSKDEDFIISSEIFKIELLEDINPRFIEIILNSKIGQKQFNKYKIGAIMGSLSQEAIKQIKIPLPPLATQNHIVQLMDKAYYSKKQKETKAKQLLDSINDYVLDELRIKLPELEDKMVYVVYFDDVKNNRIDAYYYQPKFKEVEEAINKGKFEVKELKEVVKKIKTGTTPHQKLEPFTEKKEVIFLRNTNLYKNKIILDDVRYIKKELSKNLTYSSKNDIIICIAGTLRLTAVNVYDEKISINQNISSLTLKENINPHFVSAILNLNIYDLFFKRVASLATIFYINNDNLLSIKISLPPLNIQNKIAEEVKRRMQKAEQLQKEAKEELENAKQEIEKIILGDEKSNNADLIKYPSDYKN